MLYLFFIYLFIFLFTIQIHSYETVELPCRNPSLIVGGYRIVEKIVSHAVQRRLIEE